MTAKALKLMKQRKGIMRKLAASEDANPKLEGRATRLLAEAYEAGGLSAEEAFALLAD